VCLLDTLSRIQLSTLIPFLSEDRHTIHTPRGKRGISCFSADFPCGGKCGKVWLVDKTRTIDQGNSFMTWRVPG